MKNTLKTRRPFNQDGNGPDKLRPKGHGPENGPYCGDRQKCGPTFRRFISKIEESPTSTIVASGRRRNSRRKGPNLDLKSRKTCYVWDQLLSR